MAEHPWQTNGPVAQALVNLVAVLADNKYFLGRRVGEWSTGAPELESAVACAALCQEELGHARALYPLLLELPVPNPPKPLVHEQDRERRYSLSLLDKPLERWTEMVAALTLVDAALVTALEGLRGSRYEDLARRAVRILDEERYHADFARGRVRALVEEGKGPNLQQQMERFLPEVLCWFGPAGEPGVEAMRAAGVFSWDNEGMRQAFLGRVVSMLADAGLQLAAVRNGREGARWEYGELPWNQWNALQRRLSSNGAGRSQ